MSESTTTRDLILQEAAHLFRQNGYLGTNLRDLAARVGIKGGSIYHHFASKQDILCEVMLQTMDEMIARLREALEEAETPSDMLVNMVRFHIDYIVTGADRAYVTDDELRNLEPDNYREVVARRDRYQRMVEEIFERGIDEENWQVADVKLCTRALIKACAGVASWYRPEGGKTLREIADIYAGLFLQGLRPRPQMSTAG